jgi:hypothetical protein
MVITLLKILLFLFWLRAKMPEIEKHSSLQLKCVNYNKTSMTILVNDYNFAKNPSFSVLEGV